MDFSKLKKYGGSSSPDKKFWSIFSAVAAAAVIVLIFTGIWLYGWAMEAIVHQKPEIRMPDLTGKSSVYALKTLSEVKLSLRIQGSEKKADLPRGAVIRQVPAADKLIREGETVLVTVSEGGSSVFTPTLTGMSLRNAKLLLEQNDLKLGYTSKAYSLQIPKGTVVTQDPAPESIVEKNTKVNVNISDGNPPEGINMMPNFVNKDLETVKAWAKKYDAKVEYKEDPKSEKDNGIIAAQTPEPDVILNEKTEISVTVSTKKREASETEGDYKIEYTAPATGEDLNISIRAIGKEGEKEIFSGKREPGAKIELYIFKKDVSKIRIFLNDQQVEERKVK